MLRRIDLRAAASAVAPDAPADGRVIAAQLPRASAETLREARDVAAEVLAAIRTEGDAAVRRYAARFDGWTGEKFEVPPDRAQAALARIDTGLRAALEAAASRIRWFHEQARPHDWLATSDGARLGVRHRPLRRVGAYAPGGRSPLVSSVLMTAVPARVAGVDEVVLASPPGPGGVPDEGILAAAALAGVDRILAIGGAQAIAALAYGTETVPACDKVLGPGNTYVAEAKRLVAAEGVCGIDTHAGATEVAIIADDTADARLVAADLVAQAEHDPQAACLLITPSEALADRVEAVLREEVAATRHTDRVRAALDGQGAVALVADLDQAVTVADAYAAEHLEVQTADAAAVADRIRSAGGIFVGRHTPVALGDYAAGPNHTLPTAGTARFAGGLRTDDFLVPVNWVEYGAEALERLAPTVDALSAAEDLPAHARAVRVRLEDRGA